MAPKDLAVEQLLHQVVARLAWIGDWAGLRVRFVRAGTVGLEALDVAKLTVRLHLKRRCRARV